VLATDNIVNFVRARTGTMYAWSAATVLVACAFGCRQVDTLGPGNASISADCPKSPPAVSHSTMSAQVVEVCRFPTGEADENPSADASQTATVNCNLSEALGTMELLADHEYMVLDDCEQLPPNFGDATRGLAALAVESADPSAGQPLSSGEAGDRGFRSWCGETLATTRDNVFRDYANYYSRNTLGEFIVILAPAAVFANSDLDQDAGNWYQQHIRSAATNHASDFFRPLGNGYYTIPAYVSAKLLGEYFDDQPGMALLGEFGDRTTRALLVGAPPFLALQYLTGGGRPSAYADESYWRPFRGSHGASGHAFMGAVPFLTLAGMTDDPLAKCLFYACSPWTGFTRINDNVHYLSQVWLGWWMAYLACDAVNKTEKQQGPLVIAPLCTPEMTGIGVVYQR
jgi:hypothetical protein